MPTALLTPILDSGIKNTHFFQGRLLSAEDMQAEQEANRTHHRQLGRAIGAGVVEGLEVRLDTNGSGPVLGIDGGVAINPKGETLELADDVKLALLLEPGDIPPEAGVFAPCVSQAAGNVFIDDGIYILLMCPASGFRERAPMSGLEADGKSIGCGSRYAVEGVLFRVERLDIESVSGIADATRTELQSLIGASDAASVSKLRNLLAHLSFGTEARAEALINAAQGLSDGASPRNYGLLDALRSADVLTEADVPLALFHWASDGIRFLDMWSVRRRPTPQVGSGGWPALLHGRRLAEAEATLAQFAEHIEDIRKNETNLDAIEAGQRFTYLPPVGILPLTGVTAPAGFSAEQFFKAQAIRDPAFMDAALGETLLRIASVYPPIDVRRQEWVRIYHVIEAGTPPPFLVFTSGRVHFEVAEPRYDLARWDFSHYV